MHIFFLSFILLIPLVYILSFFSLWWFVVIHPKVLQPVRIGVLCRATLSHWYLSLYEWLNPQSWNHSSRYIHMYIWWEKFLNIFVRHFKDDWCGELIFLLFLFYERKKNYIKIIYFILYIVFIFISRWNKIY